MLGYITTNLKILLLKHFEISYYLCKLYFHEIYIKFLSWILLLFYKILYKLFCINIFILLSYLIQIFSSNLKLCRICMKRLNNFHVWLSCGTLLNTEITQSVFSPNIYENRETALSTKYLNVNIQIICLSRISLVDLNLNCYIIRKIEFQEH